MAQQQQHGPAIQPTTTTPQFEHPRIVLIRGRRTIVDPDVMAPLYWGSDEQQLEALDTIRGAGL